MSGIKGVVLLTRFDFIEERRGRDGLKKLMDKIKLDDKRAFSQPIGISKEYPEIYLSAIDDMMLKELFDNDLQQFRELGHWNARVLMPRYFQIYLEDQNILGFLEQMGRMRPILIGLGEMGVAELSRKMYLVRINYGQPYLESVHLSELGFLEEGCRMCGAKNFKSETVESDEISVEYQMSWK